MTTTYTSYLKTPIGTLKIITSATAVQKIDFWNGKKTDASTSEPAILKSCKKQLTEFFAGKRQNFDLKLDLQGTPFQKKVWQALCKIPYGKTVSYKTIAEKIASPQAFRAVGGANNKNPIPVIVPCHRVIGADGSMVGYGGGVSKKIKLCALEQSFRQLSL